MPGRKKQRVWLRFRSNPIGSIGFKPVLKLVVIVALAALVFGLVKQRLELKWKLSNEN
jgi:hypothetical protein